MIPGLRSVFTSLLAFLCFSGIGAAQNAPAKFWIFFNDKAGAENSIASLRKGGVAPFARSLGISGRAIERRGKCLPADALIRAEDLPVPAAYKAEIERSGASIAAESRWLNAVSAVATPDQLARIARLPFVSSVEPVRSWKMKPDAESPAAGMPRPSKGKAAHGLDYGASLEQNEMLRVPDVHDIWIDGTGILVGMNDDGFRWRAHEAMKGMQVLREYDFIQKDSLTENGPSDAPGQDAHGTLTMSTLGGFMEGQLIGPAYNASFELAKTEIYTAELPIEEDYWVQGLEWHERNGADVVSSSLGYNVFDDSTGYYYDRGDFDGRHAVTSRAAGQAARFGVLVVTAMGNEGNSVGSILAPADADSILAVGAVHFDGSLAGFSSIGPTNDGRIKPDVAAPGVSVYCATRDSTQTYTRASGTSLATPMAAGVAALVFSARPDLTPMQAREAVKMTAGKASSPNNLVGWGLVNAWDAVLYHGMVISSRPRVWYKGGETQVLAFVVSRNAVDPASVTLYYTSEAAGYLPVRMSMINATPGMGSGSGLYAATVPKFPVGQLIRYYISARDEKETRSVPWNAPGRYLTLKVGDSYLAGAAGLLPAEFILYQNYPNPVPLPGGRTTIAYQLPRDASVKLEIFDLLGRRAAVVRDDFESMGTHEIPFDARLLPAGMYFYRLTGNGFSDARRMIVLK